MVLSSGSLSSTWDRCVDVLYPHIKEANSLPQETKMIQTKRFDNEIDLLTFVNSVEDIINVQDLGDSTYVVEYLA
jgi:hypothetical protein